MIENGHSYRGVSFVLVGDSLLDEFVVERRRFVSLCDGMEVYFGRLSGTRALGRFTLAAETTVEFRHRGFESVHRAPTDKLGLRPAIPPGLSSPERVMHRVGKLG